MTMVRGVQSVLTRKATGDGRYLMHDDEVRAVLGEWQGFLNAAMPT